MLGKIIFFILLVLFTSLAFLRSHRDDVGILHFQLDRAEQAGENHENHSKDRARFSKEWNMHFMERISSAYGFAPELLTPLSSGPRMSASGFMGVEKFLLPRASKQEIGDELGHDGEGVASVHSSSLVSLGNGNFFVVYFGGSREGARDVSLYAHFLSLDSSLQLFSSPAFLLLTRDRLLRDSKQYIKKIGNPMLFSMQDGIHLLVSAGVFGGWATARVYHYKVEFFPRMDLKFLGSLHTSAFLNLSTLVRTNAVHVRSKKMEGVIVPMYHELASKYPLLGVFDFKARLIKILRPTNQTSLLQPAIAPIDEKNYVLAYRSHGSPYVFYQFCSLLASCKPVQQSPLVNQDSSINILSLDSRIYLLYNHPLSIAGHFFPRGELSLGALDVSRGFVGGFEEGGSRFSYLRALDRVQEGEHTRAFFELSYPSSVIFSDFVLTSYTVDRKYIGILLFRPEFLGANF